MSPFMKPASEHLIMFQALISELKAYCGEASHGRVQRWLGFDIILDTYLGAGGSKPENAENG